MANTNFRNQSLPPELVQALESLRFEKLTPIQAQCLAPLRQGKDVIAQSQTGSGKTVAFGLPLMERIQTDRRVLQGLVICPTRELCEQVTRVLRQLGRFKKDLLIATLVGGEPLYLQLKALRHGVQIAVGTPGRLMDLIGRSKLDVREVTTVVLDEADRMLEMGFREAVEAILEDSPKERQTALFSATFPPTIESLSRHYQNRPERITVVSSAADKPEIEQTFFAVDEKSRMPALKHLLATHEYAAALVFCNLKVSVDDVTQFLVSAGLSVDKLHGGMEQRDRDRVMARFRNGTTRVLIATDVAARGLDVSGLDAVFNYELAKDPEIHLHRIGRTGRAGKAGLALSLWAGSELHKLTRIESLMGIKLRRGSLDWSQNVKASKTQDFATLEISGGRKDKLRAGDILGALTGKDCGLLGEQIGKIEIRDHVSFVAVERQKSEHAMKTLRSGRIKARRFVVSILASGHAISERRPSPRPRPRSF